MTTTLRREQPGDERAIHAVHAGSFPTDAEARLVDALRGAGRLTLSLVAEIDGRIVGHVGFSPVTVAGGGDGVGVGLAPVAVLTDYRKRGIAADLIRWGLEISRADSAGFVVVLGEPEYYSRFGFTAAANWNLSDEYGGGAAFQAIELRPNSISSSGGLVQYAPEFSIFA